MALEGLRHIQTVIDCMGICVFVYIHIDLFPKNNSYSML